MKWNPIDHEVLTRRLTLPRTGRLRVILDTDTYNEMDDQFAVCYLLGAQERLQIEALCAAPFHNENSSGPADGMEKSYEEILCLLHTAGREDLKERVYRGSTRYLPDQDTPVESDAADVIIRAAHQTPDGEQLYVAAIGAITNVASAILKDPSIIDKICVVWLGGHAHHWNDTFEFNCFQDFAAASVVFDCGVPLVQAPCSGVVTHLSTTEPELREMLQGKGAVAQYLYDTTIRWAKQHHCLIPCWSKVIWDIVTIAYLINPDFTPSYLTPAPHICGGWYGFDSRRHPMRYIYRVDRDAIFRDMFARLQNMGD